MSYIVQHFTEKNCPVSQSRQPNTHRPELATGARSARPPARFSFLGIAEAMKGKRAMFSGQKCALVIQKNLAVVVFVCGSLIVPCTHHQAHAEIQFELDGSFIDDFEDGDPGDGLPTTWIPFGPSNELYISNGDFITDRLRILPHQSLSYVELWKTMPTDFSIRTQARMLEIKDEGGMLPGLGPAVSISGRTCNEGLGLGHVCNDPEVGDFPGMDWIYIDVRPNGEVHTGQGVEAEERVVETDIRPLDEDFNMQFDAFGQEIKFWVWPAGEPRPVEPLVAYASQDNPTLAPGGLMFGTVYAKAAFRYVQVSDTPITDDPQLLPGDADQDNDYDQLDLVRVQIAGRYLTGQPATWGEGDWDGAPGGTPGAPPAGNGRFDQFDIIAAASRDIYLTGPYAAIGRGGTKGDDQTSLIYDANTGEFSIDAPLGQELTSINLISNAGMFIGNKPAVLDGAFDNFAADNVFKATFGGSFGSISFGNVLPAGIAENDLADDLSVAGSLAGGGDLGEVDFVYVPEPATGVLFLCSFVIAFIRPPRWNQRA